MFYHFEGVMPFSMPVPLTDPQLLSVCAQSSEIYVQDSLLKQKYFQKLSFCLS
jgi:hypothetical protein